MVVVVVGEGADSGVMVMVVVGRGRGRLQIGQFGGRGGGGGGCRGVASVGVVFFSSELVSGRDKSGGGVEDLFSSSLRTMER